MTYNIYDHLMLVTRPKLFSDYDDCFYSLVDQKGWIDKETALCFSSMYSKIRPMDPKIVAIERYAIRRNNVRWFESVGMAFEAENDEWLFL